MNLSGIGYDVHQFAEGRKLVLGGVEIPHERGLDGHSDADVLCHAIADAILGAAGERDIGYHFPNTDESIRGISSLQILADVRQILLDQQMRILNVDATVIAEAPKINPHLDGMKSRLSAALQLDPRRIGIKATTNETLGFIGRGEGMAAMAVATVHVPDILLEQPPQSMIV